MHTLNDYILSEALDVDNLYYKIDTWFSRKENEKNCFYNLINKHKENNTKSTKEEVDEFVKSNNFKVKQFVDYMSDNINTNDVNDYLYVFQKIIDTVSANKQQ